MQAKAFELMDNFEKTGSIDIFSNKPDIKFSTTPLFGEPRGKMFGILHGIDTNNNEIFLFAFSGQYATEWRVNGWVSPLFDLDLFAIINEKSEKKIKKISAHLSRINTTQHVRLATILKTKRKKISQQLMVVLHSLYRLHNFNG